MASKAREPAALDDLPVEMVCELLRRLSLPDLTRLKMTAKRYLQIVSDFRVKQLNVGVNETSNSIDHCHPNLFILQLVQPILSPLQQLSINARLNDHFDLNELNRFTRLVQLKIGYELPEGDKLILDLPDLRQLEISCNRTREIRVLSTKLEKLTYYGDGNLLQVEHPETVVTLDSDLPREHLRSFPNVLCLQSSSNFYILSKETLLDFPDLKKVAYTATCDDVSQAFRDHSGWTFNLSPNLKRFMDEKKALDRTDLKVQFTSFELVDHKSIWDYEFEKRFFTIDGRSIISRFSLDLDPLQLYAHNYDQLIEPFPFPEADYGQLMNVFNGRIPDDLFSKFVGTKRVKVKQTCSNVDEGHLLRFLRPLSALEVLILEPLNLSESFFRGLVEICSGTLRSMIVRLKYPETLPNLDFPSEFRALNSFTVDINLSTEEIRWLLNMSWSSKSEFHLKFQHYDPKSQDFIEYGVTRQLDSEEVSLYRGERHFLDSETIELRTCPLGCLDELVEYFENF